MIIKCYGETHKYLLFMDLEFDRRSLVQFAGLLFKCIDEEDNTYQLMRSCNAYVSREVCYPFAEYTGVTSSFLKANGVRLSDLKTFIFNDFLADVDFKDLEIISHGLRNDRLILVENGINLSLKENGEPIDGFCTFTNARRILKRASHLTLNDICEECGYYLHAAHNAFNDVWGEVAIFTYLLKQREVHRQEGGPGNNEVPRFRTT